jgi:SPX domain protein involved in polyphosphate accumulation
MLLLDKINEIIETKDFRKNKATIKECYRGIQLLHNFRVLNFTSWVKIMKKYNKYSSAVPEKDITRILEFMKRTPLVCNNKLFELQMKIEEIYRRFFHPKSNYIFFFFNFCNQFLLKLYM